eukprot:4556213-Amphidinium_carterae.1
MAASTPSSKKVLRMCRISLIELWYKRKSIEQCISPATIILLTGRQGKREINDLPSVMPEQPCEQKPSGV